jgi:hypothetical protein
MLRHSCAHFLQASAHCRHMSLFIFSHACAQASHMSAHMLHICFTYSLPLHIIMEAILHMSAQSRHIIIHRAIAVMSICCMLPVIDIIVMHSVQQASQAIAQLLQLSIHVWYCWFFNIEEVVFISFSCITSFISLSKKYVKKGNYMQYLHIYLNKNMTFRKNMCNFYIYYR